jgi:hypothetical protein
MLLSSPLFLKAVSIIAKQRPNLPAISTGPVNSPIASTSKGKKKNKAGRLFRFLFHCLLTYSIYLEPLAKFLNASDVDFVTRARDNAVMAEISKEDPQGHSEYQDAVRHQIVAMFQRLRLALLVLDTLMEAYTTST